jgi:virginiamycin B lyase
VSIPPASLPTSTPAGQTSTPTAITTTAPVANAYELVEYDVPAGAHPHDVAPAPDGTVWYTGQNNGTLGRLDPATGAITEIDLGPNSSPHGVIVDRDGAAWVTDSGRNEIQRVDPATDEITRYPLPGSYANLNTAAIDANGTIWFTGQAGYYGRVIPATAAVEVFEAPRGRGPYGIDATPDGDIWFVSLAGSYLAQVDLVTGAPTVHEPPTAGQGARRVWADSRGRLWISEANAGQLGMYDPATDGWREWPLPGANAQPYSIYVDELDLVWLTDFGANAIVRFDPASEQFESFVIPTANSAIRQQLGRPGELWGAESATDKLVVLRLVDDSP